MDSKRIWEIQNETPYPNSKQVRSALHKVWLETLMVSPWQPIETAPKDGSWIMLLLDSGYKSTPYSVTIAKFVEGYHNDGKYDYRWRDHANDSVFDGFPKIVAWRPWEPPKLDFEPVSNQYDYLERGNVVLPGDEIFVEDHWTIITKGDIDSCMKLTGQAFVCKGGTIRRLKKMSKYVVEYSSEKVYVHCTETGATVARLCKLSIEIMKDPLSEGYDFVSRTVNWELFKEKVKEILGYEITIDKPELTWGLLNCA